jgi:hypothetical protein
MSNVFYDPPSGWNYGFPKPFNPLPDESLVETLIRDGYPAKDAVFGAKHCWFTGNLSDIKQLLKEDA